ncbi:MAG TPA: DUF1517 domain-containing protein [Candidatus Sericytochromatia bacterium]
MRHSKLQRYCAIAVGTLLASTITLHPPTDTTNARLTFDAEASARSSGGRSGGGSFRSSPSRSSGSSSSPSRSSGSSSSPSRSSGFDRSPSYQRNYGGGGTVIVPVPVGPSIYNDSYRNDSYRSGGSSNGQASTDDSGLDWIVGLIFLGVSAAIVFGLVFWVVKAMRGSGGASGTDELDNDIVTVSKIQVALLAVARDIQSELTDLSLEVDTDTPEGLLQLVQEASLALLRMPENWSHVLADSQTVKSREEAEALFQKSSIAERSKFSVETLTNVGGRVNKRDGFKPNPDEDPAAYIVVTLLVGTTHDRQLFERVRTEAELTSALEQLASLPSDYLMAFELLWSPQESSDSLTYDELLTEYTEMVQL